MEHAPVNEGLTNAERAAHTLQCQASVTLEKLLVRLDAHLTDVVPGMGSEDGVGDEVLLLDFSQGDEERGVARLVQRLSHGVQGGNGGDAAVDF